MTRHGNYVYKRVQPLGRGAYGIVYRANRISDGCMVAVKEIHESKVLSNTGGDAHKAKRIFDHMEAEISSHKGLKHVNVVALLDHLVVRDDLSPGDGRLRILALEYCNGGDLSAHLERHPCMGDVELIDLMEQLAAALQYIDSERIIHRDIKPANIMLHREGEGPVMYKLTDFGLARELQLEDTAATQLGTPCYMAPEVTSGTGYTGKVDMWSLGCVLYFCATNMLPFTGQSKADICKAIHRNWGTLPVAKTLKAKSRLSRSLQNAFVALMRRLLVPNPEDRMCLAEVCTFVERLAQTPSVYVRDSRTCCTDPVYFWTPEASTLAAAVARDFGRPMDAHMLVFKGRVISADAHPPQDATEAEPVWFVDMELVGQPVKPLDQALPELGFPPEQLAAALTGNATPTAEDVAATARLAEKASREAQDHAGHASVIFAASRDQWRMVEALGRFCEADVRDAVSAVQERVANMETQQAEAAAQQQVYENDIRALNGGVMADSFMVVSSVPRTAEGRSELDELADYMCDQRGVMHGAVEATQSNAARLQQEATALNTAIANSAGAFAVGDPAAGRKAEADEVAGGQAAPLQTLKQLVAIISELAVEQVAASTKLLGMSTSGRPGLGGSFVKPSAGDLQHITSTFSSTQLQIRDTLGHALEAQRALAQTCHDWLGRIVQLRHGVSGVREELAILDNLLAEHERNLDMWRLGHAALVKELLDAIGAPEEDPVLVERPDPAGEESMYQSLPTLDAPAAEGSAVEESGASVRPTPTGDSHKLSSMVVLSSDTLTEATATETATAAVTATEADTRAEEEVQSLLREKESMTKAYEALEKEKTHFCDVARSLEEEGKKASAKLNSTEQHAQQLLADKTELQEENRRLKEDALARERGAQEEEASLARLARTQEEANTLRQDLERAQEKIATLTQAQNVVAEEARAELASVGNVLATACSQSEAQLEQVRKEKEALRDSLFQSAKEKDEEISALTVKLLAAEETLAAQRRQELDSKRQHEEEASRHLALTTTLQDQLEANRAEALQRMSDAEEQHRLVTKAMAKEREEFTQKEASFREELASLRGALAAEKRRADTAQQQLTDDHVARQTLLQEREEMGASLARLAQENEELTASSAALRLQVSRLKDESGAQLASLQEGARLARIEFEDRLRQSDEATAEAQATATALKAEVEEAVERGVESRRTADRAAFQVRLEDMRAQAEEDKRSAVDAAKLQVTAALEAQLATAQKRVETLENAMRDAALGASQSQQELRSAQQELRSAQQSQRRCRSALLVLVATVAPGIEDVSDALTPDDLAAQASRILEHERTAAAAAQAAHGAQGPQLTPFTDRSFVLTTSGCEAGDYVMFTREPDANTWSAVGERTCKLDDMHVQQSLGNVRGNAIVAKVILRRLRAAGQTLVNIEAPIWALEDL